MCKSVVDLRSVWGNIKQGHDIRTSENLENLSLRVQTGA